MYEGNICVLAYDRSLILFLLFVFVFAFWRQLSLVLPYICDSLIPCGFFCVFVSLDCDSSYLLPSTPPIPLLPTGPPAHPPPQSMCFLFIDPERRGDRIDPLAERPHALDWRFAQREQNEIAMKVNGAGCDVGHDDGGSVKSAT